MSNIPSANDASNEAFAAQNRKAETDRAQERRENERNQKRMASSTEEACKLLPGILANVAEWIDALTKRGRMEVNLELVEEDDSRGACSLAFGHADLVEEEERYWPWKIAADMAADELKAKGYRAEVRIHHTDKFVCSEFGTGHSITRPVVRVHLDIKWKATPK